MTSFCHVNDVIILQNRQRKEFNFTKLSELKDSILRHGLFSPIVIRLENDSIILVAGERRLRALKDLYELSSPYTFNGEIVPVGFIPFVSLGDLNEIEREEAELEENTRRVDLSWQERAAATERLAKLRRVQAERNQTSPPTTADLAEELRGSGEGRARETTRRELLVAKHLSNPSVAKAKNVDEAFKILKREEDIQRRINLAQTVGETYSAASAQKVYNVEALSWLSECQSETFDVILTDPPYGIDAQNFGNSSGRAGGNHFYDDSPFTFQLFLSKLLPELFRVAKPQAHLYLFCDIEWFLWLKDEASAAGWHVFRTPLVWHRSNGNRTPWPDRGPRRQYELLLYAVKGKKPCTHIYSDVLSYPSDENLGHQAQKPVDLFIDLLKRSVSPGDKLLDPCCGSGPIFPAAHALRCEAVGLEQDAAAYGICVERINNLE